MGRVIPYIVENKIHVWNHQPEPNEISGRTLFAQLRTKYNHGLSRMNHQIEGYQIP